MRVHYKYWVPRLHPGLAFGSSLFVTNYYLILILEIHNSLLPIVNLVMMVNDIAWLESSQVYSCSEYNEVVNKRAAILILQVLLILFEFDLLYLQPNKNGSSNF